MKLAALVETRREASAQGLANIVGSVGRHPARSVSQLEPQAHQIAQRLVHRQRAAGQGAVGQAHAAHALLHAVPAQHVFAVRHAGGGGGIGDAVQMRDRAQGHLDGARMHVQQVGYQLGILGVRQRRADHARLTVMQAAHGVEQVREAGCAVLQRGHAVLVRA